MLVLNIVELPKFSYLVKIQELACFHFPVICSAPKEQQSSGLTLCSQAQPLTEAALTNPTLGMSVQSLKKEQQLVKENYKKIQFTDGKQSFLWLEISGGLGKQGWQTHFKKY